VEACEEHCDSGTVTTRERVRRGDTTAGAPTIEVGATRGEQLSDQASADVPLLGAPQQVARNLQQALDNLRVDDPTRSGMVRKKRGPEGTHPIFFRRIRNIHNIMSYPWTKDSQYLPSQVPGYLAITSPNGLYFNNNTGILASGNLPLNADSISLTTSGNIGLSSGTSVNITAIDAVNITATNDSLNLNARNSNIVNTATGFQVVASNFITLESKNDPIDILADDAINIKTTDGNINLTAIHADQSGLLGKVYDSIDLNGSQSVALTCSGNINLNASSKAYINQTSANVGDGLLKVGTIILDNNFPGTLVTQISDRSLTLTDKTGTPTYTTTVTASSTTIQNNVGFFNTLQPTQIELNDDMNSTITKISTDGFSVVNPSTNAPNVMTGGYISDDGFFSVTSDPNSSPMKEVKCKLDGRTGLTLETNNWSSSDGFEEKVFLTSGGIDSLTNNTPPRLEYTTNGDQNAFCFRVNGSDVAYMAGGAWAFRNNTYITIQ
jgi:hypothetical protein